MTIGNPIPFLSPTPTGHRLRINPQAFLRFSCFLLQSLKCGITWRILPIPPPPAVFDECVIEVRAIPQKHIGKGALVLVLPVSLEDDISSKD